MLVGSEPWSLTYCGNVHAVAKASDVAANVRQFLGPLRKRLDPDGRRKSMAAGLYFGADGVAELLRDKGLLDDLDRALSESDARLLTVNAFPFGDFHAKRVKEAVYLPDWTHALRREYTLSCAEVMVRLQRSSDDLSISTLPGGFRKADADQRQKMATEIRATARGLSDISAQSGRILRLAIEPEPLCAFETTAEIAAFLEEDVFQRTPDEELLRRHVGVCLDVCHLAVEYEDPTAALKHLQSRGLMIPKIQLSSALEIMNPAQNREALHRLASFDEPRYLHQVFARTHQGEIAVFEDLTDFLAVAEKRNDHSARCHFHVPIDRAEFGPLGSTRAVLDELLTALRKDPFPTHLEVETYSWGVLPAEANGGDDLLADLESELRYVIHQLEG